MITANDVLAGKLTRSKRRFKIDGVGEMELNRLPVSLQKQGFEQAIAKPTEEKDVAELETTIIRCTYALLTGQDEPEKAHQLLDVLDEDQIAVIFRTGLFWSDFSSENLEQTEKNSQSSPSSAP